MNPAILLGILGIMMTLAGGIVGAVIFLVKVTLQVGAIVSSVKELEKKYQEREERFEETDRVVRNFGIVTEGYENHTKRLAKAESFITELRINAGVMRRTGGEVG